MTLSYRGMSGKVLDAAYNNQDAVPDFLGMVSNWKKRSADAEARLNATIDIPYGTQARQRLDYFPSTTEGAPLFVFVHGGYWQGGDKRSVGFLADGPLANGFSVALIEYTIAPEGRLSQMVKEVRMSLSWLRANASRLAFDPHRIVLAGHSAGAQLICTALDVPGVTGGIAISGLYDLEPIRLCYLNEKLALTQADVDRYSPARNLPVSACPLVVAVGAAELPELVRQSYEFANASQKTYAPIEGHDHFSVLEELAQPDGRLCRFLKPPLCSEKHAVPASPTRA